jgi:hypothetical protein
MIVIFGCMGIFHFIFLIKLLLLFFLKGCRGAGWVVYFFSFNIFFWSFFPLSVPPERQRTGEAIFCAEPRHKRISTAHKRSELAKQSGLVVYVKKGVNCLELATFGEFDGTNFYTFLLKILREWPATCSICISLTLRIWFGCRVGY